jgi:GNAT superfamily N-acetyltransferase
MTNVLDRFPQGRLAAANEANWRVGFCSLMTDWPGGTVHREPGLIWHGSHVPHPLFNGVLWSRFTLREADESIANVLEVFQARRVPLWWWLFPASAPYDLGERLEAHGLAREDDLPGMAVDIADLPCNPLAPPGMTIVRVADDAVGLAWTEAYASGAGSPDFVAAALGNIVAGDCHEEAALGWRHYVGWLDGEPVACASLFLGAGVAGLYNVATVPEARGQGIGSAMATHALNEAGRLGYRVGVLQATPAGIPLYERLGFACCCAYPQFRWNPELAGQESPAFSPNYDRKSEPREATPFEASGIPGLQRHHAD